MIGPHRRPKPLIYIYIRSILYVYIYTYIEIWTRRVWVPVPTNHLPVGCPAIARSFMELLLLFFLAGSSRLFKRSNPPVDMDPIHLLEFGVRGSGFPSFPSPLVFGILRSISDPETQKGSKRKGSFRAPQNIARKKFLDPPPPPSLCLFVQRTAQKKAGAVVWNNYP